MVGAKSPSEEAEELRSRLEVAGMDASIPDCRNGSTVSQASSSTPREVAANVTQIPSTGNSGIRLISRTNLPSHELKSRPAAGEEATHSREGRPGGEDKPKTLLAGEGILATLDSNLSRML